MVLPSPNACSKESSCIFAELRFAPFNEEPSNMLVLYTFKISSSFFSSPSLFVRSLKVILCLLDNKFAQRKSAFSKFACFKTVLFKSPLCNLAFCKSAPSKCAPPQINQSSGLDCNLPFRSPPDNGQGNLYILSWLLCISCFIIRIAPCFFADIEHRISMI